MSRNNEHKTRLQARIDSIYKTFGIKLSISNSDRSKIVYIHTKTGQADRHLAIDKSWQTLAEKVDMFYEGLTAVQWYQQARCFNCQSWFPQDSKKHPELTICEICIDRQDGVNRIVSASN